MVGSPVLEASLPAASLFGFPRSEPAFLPPPPPGSIAAAPLFSIPDHIYRAALDPRVPLTIAATYAVTIKLLNRRNASTGKKPWRISQTKAFYWFVVAHNIFLAVYSAWTFLGMFGALRRSMISPMSADGPVGWVDSLCKMSGPGGLGNAVQYGHAQDRWMPDSPDYRLMADGTPQRDDTGRLWNEGLAFYGWIFYLSKFYEVLDTFIILAKGKLSSTLQTYHHAGAMMCMWAGMRYMSPPIWMFVFVNSGIHAMMYTYYTLNVFNVKVPIFIKRTLTSMQITQFLVGASYAMAHSFVSYTYTVTDKITKAASASGVSSAVPAASSPPSLLDSLKNLVGVKPATLAQPTAATAAAAAATTASSSVITSYVQRQQTVPCITTTGQTFAIWLNVIYLAPLTYLFVKFFITSYLRRAEVNAKTAQSSKARRASQVAAVEEASWEAAKEVEKEVYGEVVVDEEAEDESGVVVVDGVDAAANGNGNGKANGNARSSRRRKVQGDTS